MKSRTLNVSLTHFEGHKNEKQIVRLKYVSNSPIQNYRLKTCTDLKENILTMLWVLSYQKTGHKFFFITTSALKFKVLDLPQTTHFW